jgi:hypothetical protein
METDLFGQPVPVAAPVYDRQGVKPIPAAVVAAKVVDQTDTPHRPYTILKESKTSTWIFYK